MEEKRLPTFGVLSMDVVSHGTTCRGGVLEDGKTLLYPADKVAIPFVNCRNDARADLNHSLRVPTTGIDIG